MYELSTILSVVMFCFHSPQKYPRFGAVSMSISRVLMVTSSFYGFRIIARPPSLVYSEARLSRSSRLRFRGFAHPRLTAKGRTHRFQSHSARRHSV